MHKGHDAAAGVPARRGLLVVVDSHREGEPVRARHNLADVVGKGDPALAGC